MLDQVRNQLNSQGVNRDSKLLLAFSGGVDSVVILDILVKIGFTNITLAHYDHNLRLDSDQENYLVGRLANKYQVALIEGRYQSGKSDEASLRQARHNFLEEQLGYANSDYLVLAHHQDDLIETIVANAIRGAGIKGYSPFANRKTVLRPMLGLNKNQLYRYANSEGLEFIEDYTNYQLNYQRNLYRWLLLPNLNSTDRDLFLVHHQNMDQSLRSINQNLKSWTKLNLIFRDSAYRVDKKLIQGLDQEFIIAWLDWLFNRDKLGFYSSKRLELMTNWLLSTTNNKRFSVGKKWLVMNDGWLIFEGLTDMIEKRISD
ncbi:tRNA lysidine(34) synthetase TilS [Candidatus Saccharibacteria bacterium]|nr:tRNA lysidine(34) synthetase TilS [Candidatus Saccharibacteria bacterium]